MCILDDFFPLVWKKTSYGSKMVQNLKIDQCMKKTIVLHASCLNSQISLVKHKYSLKKLHTYILDIIFFPISPLACFLIQLSNKSGIIYFDELVSGLLLFTWTGSLITQLCLLCVPLDVLRTRVISCLLTHTLTASGDHACAAAAWTGRPRGPGAKVICRKQRSTEKHWWPAFTTHHVTFFIV